MAERPSTFERKYRELRRKGVSRKVARALTEAENDRRRATAEPEPSTPPAPGRTVRRGR